MVLPGIGRVNHVVVGTWGGHLARTGPGTLKKASCWIERNRKMLNKNTIYCARYTCLVCEHRWELETTSTDDNDNHVNCPECGAELQCPDDYDTFRDVLIRARDKTKRAAETEGR